MFRLQDPLCVTYDMQFVPDQGVSTPVIEMMTFRTKER